MKLNKQDKQILEDLLNSRWSLQKDKRAVDVAFYEGCVEVLEQLGIEWRRHEDGVHLVF